MEHFESFLRSVAQHPVGFWVLVIGTTLAAWTMLGLMLWCGGRLVGRWRGPHGGLGDEPDPPSLNEPAVPDEPLPFGYKVCWLAIRADSTQQVIDWLRLSETRPANWRQGLEAAYAYNATVFITPPVRGWVFVVGSVLPGFSTGDYDFISEAVVAASSAEVFGEVQAFGSHRVSNFAAWLWAREGELLRAFIGAEEPEYEAGSVTDDECSLGFEIDADGVIHADEQTVMELAGRWSVNPQELDQVGLPPQTGLVGHLTSWPST